MNNVLPFHFTLRSGPFIFDSRARHGHQESFCLLSSYPLGITESNYNPSYISWLGSQRIDGQKGFLNAAHISFSVHSSWCLLIMISRRAPEVRNMVMLGPAWKWTWLDTKWTEWTYEKENMNRNLAHSVTLSTRQIADRRVKRWQSEDRVSMARRARIEVCNEVYVPGPGPASW